MAVLATRREHAVVLFNTVWNFITFVLLVVEPIFQAVMGAVLGFIFVVAMKKIPGKSVIQKSLVFSLILAGISICSSIVTYLRPYSTFPIPTELTVLSFVVPLVEYPLLGWLFGFVLQRKLKSIKL